ncbi:hypothetical protein GQR58_024446 [Nymphon striatum]|nr:hypothetical protein GQR58_024446 [Nymphon striatum]
MFNNVTCNLLFSAVCVVNASPFSNVGLNHPDHVKHLQSILKLHKGGFTDPPNPDFPPGFKNHPGTVSKKSRIQEISIMSELLYGTKCVFFSTFTTNKDIDLAIAFASGNHETLTSIPGNKHQVRRITIGVGTSDAYKIVFHVYAYSGNKFQKTVNGEAFIGKVFVVDGPCSPDKKVLDCRFDYGLCHWRLHDKKYIWYPVPFGLNHTVAHKLEWGALAAFGGEGSLWSPLVTSVAARCFSFVYAKGATDKSFLRVWLLYRITGGADKRALLYEDVSFHKVIKKLVQINLFVPFNFQYLSVMFDNELAFQKHAQAAVNKYITSFKDARTGQIHFQMPGSIFELSDLQSILKLHKGGFTDPPNPDFPPQFITHPGTDMTLSNFPVLIIVSLPVSITAPNGFREISLMSELLYGTKCVFFSTFTTNKDIDLAIAFASGNHETLTSIPGNKHQVRRITIGVGTSDAYKFFVISFMTPVGKANSWIQVSETFAMTGCTADYEAQFFNKKVLDCRFDYGLCHWRLHDKKYIWYPVPFGLNHTVAHKLEWGALAAFGGEGSLWSPLVTSVAARCFSFVYAKGATDKSFLRVWLLYRITGGADKRALLYEDVSFHKVIKKLVQINLFVPFNFQIAFEGRSHTILHGVVVLQTALSKHHCRGIAISGCPNKNPGQDSGFCECYGHVNPSKDPCGPVALTVTRQLLTNCPCDRESCGQASLGKCTGQGQEMEQESIFRG